MRTVAVTGGIGSGKSVVCGILSSLGAPVYNCDAAAKKLYAEDDSLLDRIEEAFGQGFKLSGGGVDLKRLSETVFSDREKLGVLERIVHPAVLEDFLRWRTVKEASKGVPTGSGTREGAFCIIESAIILEKPDFLRHTDAVVLVDAPVSTRLERACARDGSSAEEVIRRMSVQKFDISKVDAVIRNDKSPEALREEVVKVFRSLGFLGPGSEEPGPSEDLL